MGKVIAFIVAGFIGLGVQTAAAAETASSPLKRIPIEAFAALPELHSPRLSPDGRQWYQVADRSSGEWRSWQELSFTARTVKAIKLRGLYNSVNTSFHVVELEAYPHLAEPVGNSHQ